MTGPVFEIDIDRLNNTVAQLSTALEAVSRLCLLRHSGFCYANCPGQVLCPHEGLTILPWRELPATIKEVLQT